MTNTNKTHRNTVAFAPELPASTLAWGADMNGIYKHLCLRRIDWAKHAYYKA